MHRMQRLHFRSSVVRSCVCVCVVSWSTWLEVCVVLCMQTLPSMSVARRVAPETGLNVISTNFCPPPRARLVLKSHGAWITNTKWSEHAAARRWRCCGQLFTCTPSVACVCECVIVSFIGAWPGNLNRCHMTLLRVSREGGLCNGIANWWRVQIQMHVLWCARRMLGGGYYVSFWPRHHRVNWVE